MAFRCIMVVESAQWGTDKIIKIIFNLYCCSFREDGLDFTFSLLVTVSIQDMPYNYIHAPAPCMLRSRLYSDMYTPANCILTPRYPTKRKVYHKRFIFIILPPVQTQPLPNLQIDQKCSYKPNSSPSEPCGFESSWYHSLSIIRPRSAYLKSTPFHSLSAT